MCISTDSTGHCSQWYCCGWCHFDCILDDGDCDDQRPSHQDLHPQLTASGIGSHLYSVCPWSNFDSTWVGVWFSNVHIKWNGFISYSIMEMFILTLDRFLTVFCPFSYKKRARKVPLLVVSIVFFVVCFVLVILPALGVGCYTFSATALSCVAIHQCDTSKYLCHTSMIISYSLLIIVGGVIPVAIYIAMYIKAKMIQSSTPQLGEFQDEEELGLP